MKYKLISVAVFLKQMAKQKKRRFKKRYLFFLIGMLVAFSFVLLFFSVAQAKVPVQQEPNPNDPSSSPPPISPTPTPTPISNDPDFTNPFGLGENEYIIYQAYLSAFVKPTGAAISNPEPVPWCPNSCIGCDGDVTSEAVGRSLSFSARSSDKPIVDRYTNYYWMVMRHPGTGHMMWKIDETGQVGSCGGQNSAVDGELEAIEGLEYAKERWGADAQGITYTQTQREIMDSLKDGIVTTLYGQALPNCLYPTSNDLSTAKALPCSDADGKPVVYIGYLNLVALKYMCDIDATWCSVHSGSRAVVLEAFRDNGIYTSYSVGSGLFGEREHYIHNLWVLKHACEDGLCTEGSEPKKHYDTARAVYYGQLPHNGENICAPDDSSCSPSLGLICDQFIPKRGCKIGSRPGSYGEYLEMAVALGDVQFAKDLRNTIYQKCFEDGDQLCNPDNYGNVAILQALAEAREAGILE